MSTPKGTAEQLRFPTLAGHTVRAQFDGGTMSSDFGVLMLQGVERQIGMIDRLAAALTDRRHPSYVEHSLKDLLGQRIYQVACGYEDQIDANSLRHDPMFKMSVGRLPCDEDQALASQSTHSRLENAARRKDVYRAAVALVEQFVASYPEAPPIIVLEFDHSEDRTHGQQAFSFYNAHYRQHCYLPLLVFEGLSGRMVTAILRPGKTPTGRENAAILKRILKILRGHWPDTHIVVRGDGHFSNPELMDLIDQDPCADFVFGLSGNSVLNRWAQPIVKEAAKVHKRRCDQAGKAGEPPPQSTRLYEERCYQAGSWSKPQRVILKAEVMALGENPRFVVTSLDRPTPQAVYEELYCPRGNDENYIKALKLGFKSDRTSDCSFLANYMRLIFACAAYVLVHALRTETLRGTELEKAEPLTLMNKLFKIATKVVQYKDRIIVHLPTTCTVKHLLKKVTEILYIVPPLMSTS